MMQHAGNEAGWGFTMGHFGAGWLFWLLALLIIVALFKYIFKRNKD